MGNPKYLRPDFDFCLSHAIEEAGEFLSAAGKLQRWGPFSVNPELPPSERETNLAWMRREMQDVIEAFERLETAIEGEFP